MSITELKKLVPSPTEPFEIGTLKQWRVIEKELGSTLPKDYREFVFAYGSGLFAGFYRVDNPFAASEYMAIQLEPGEGAPEFEPDHRAADGTRW